MPQASNDTLMLDDAIRIGGPLSFHMMFKPAGALCNLGCRYCYYLDKSELYGGHEPRMSMEMLEEAEAQFDFAPLIERAVKESRYHYIEP